MLVLTRKPREQLYVGDDIIVTVLSVQGGRVRLGFEAPPHVAVHRQEVLQRRMAELEANEADSDTVIEPRVQSS